MYILEQAFSPQNIINIFSPEEKMEQIFNVIFQYFQYCYKGLHNKLKALWSDFKKRSSQVSSITLRLEEKLQQVSG